MARNRTLAKALIISIPSDDVQKRLTFCFRCHEIVHGYTDGEEEAGLGKEPVLLGMEEKYSKEPQWYMITSMETLY
jgi:hypothetical protein